MVTNLIRGSRTRLALGTAALGLVLGSSLFAGLSDFTSKATPAEAAGKVRQYHIAANEIQWNYAPSGSNQFLGAPFTPEENIFVGAAADRIGSTYKKAQYVEYTDATFTTAKVRPASEQHLGILGPTLRAEVGDTIKISFKNNTQHPVSMHPHGVFYNKDSEGAPYNDGTTGAFKADDAVAPAGTHTYIWEVPRRAGPGPMDVSSVLWSYHSHTDEVADTNSGLNGAIIVTKKGLARTNGTPNDVDREFVTLYTVFDENASLYIDENTANLPAVLGGLDPETLKADEAFAESNLMHSINGYVYGNLPGLVMKAGDRVRWYTIGLGTEVDLHTPHWHGNTGLFMGMRMDMIELLPMSMKILDMVPDNIGEWAFHCHVNDHITAGMMAKFTVLPGNTALGQVPEDTAASHDAAAPHSH